MKLTDDELIRKAFIWAEQDRVSYADCWEKGSLERKEVEAQYVQLRAYRMKHWGKTKIESVLENAKPVKVMR